MQSCLMISGLLLITYIFMYQIPTISVWDLMSIQQTIVAITYPNAGDNMPIFCMDV